MRNGSSLNDCSGAAGVINRRACRSLVPLNGSMSSLTPNVKAMEFTVKSRRPRSPTNVSPYSTAGLRESGSYSSLRYVVISISKSPCRAAMVPNSRPTSQMASAQPVINFVMSSGRAFVVKSRSWPNRPNSASRTLPPTSDSSNPAAVKRSPSSPMTGLAATTRLTSACCSADTRPPSIHELSTPTLGRSDARGGMRDRRV